MISTEYYVALTKPCWLTMHQLQLIVDNLGATRPIFAGKVLESSF